MTLSGRGYVTLAAGHRRYLEMAVDMALSLREHTPHPVVLAADDALGRLGGAEFPGAFDEVVPIGPRFLRGRVRKFGVGEASPFEETIFIDADCLVLASPDGLWDAASDAPVTMVGEMLSPGEDWYHHGFSTRALMTRFGLVRYLKTNSGVFHFRKAGGPEALEACRRCYVDELTPALSRRRRWQNLGDEIGFGVAGGRLGFGRFSGPGPMLWPHEMRGMDVARPAKPVLHFIGPIPSRALGSLLARVEARRHARGFPARASLRHWRWEAWSSRGAWTLNQTLRRVIAK